MAMIKELRISNFKSIKRLELDCKRINLFIGAPNVGKSNILEAMSLFNVPYVRNPENKFNGLVRFSNLKNLFYDNIPNQNIEVITDIASAILRYQSNSDNFHILIGHDPKMLDDSIVDKSYNELKNHFMDNHEKFSNENIKLYLNFFNKDGKELDPHPSDFYSSIRKYDFINNSRLNQGFHEYLLPPNGKNLITIIQNNPDIFNEIASFFDDYKLELLYDVESNMFEIQKKVKKLVYKYPFHLIADTLQRIIFYLTVVETNKNTSIILEEPETHSFPPYTRMLAERIAENQSNQFFISTHSPYLLHNIIEDTDLKDLNICITYYQDYQTKLKILSAEDIGNILDNYTDIFYNLDKFIADE